MRRLASIIVVSLLAAAFTAAASPAPHPGEGTKAFIARPKFGAAVFDLPAAVRWRATPIDAGRYRIELTADVNAAAVLANVPQLSARALNRDIACDHAVKVKSAAAKLTGPRTMRYDLRFHYAKRLCAGMALEYPAEVTCIAKVAVAAAKSVITIDVQGLTNPPCRIEGLATSVSDAVTSLVGIDVFKRHTIDVARLLPKEFQGVAIDIRALAFDMPPAAPVLHVAGEGTMTAQQYQAFLVRIGPQPAGLVRRWPR